MRALFVNADGFFYNNSSTMQNIGIVLGLNQLGYEVDLLTLQPQKGTVGYDPVMQSGISQCIQNTYVIPLSSLYRKLNKGKKHMVENTGQQKKWITELKGTIRRIIKSILIFDIRVLNLFNLNHVDIDLSQYDVIISASDPKSTHCFANYLVQKYQYKGRYIQYWGDPLYLDITRDRSFIDFLCKFLERKTLSVAGKVVYATPFTLEEQQHLYPEFAYKMAFAHQAAVGLYNNGTSTYKSNKEPDKEKCTVVYCGDYRRETRNIIPLYNAVKLLGNPFELHIYGTSNIELDSFTNISINGQVSRERADSAEIGADILVCICNLKGSQIPGKVYYLTCLNKPIVVIVDGNYKDELKEYFTRLHRFIVCDNDEESIQKALKLAREMSDSRVTSNSLEFSPIHMAKVILK